MTQMSLIISGFGGQGSLFAGILLCHSAVFEGKCTTWIPSYGAEIRGGAVNCSVNVADEEIPSPIIDEADVVIALNDESQTKFENRVKKGGIMIINSSLSQNSTTRDDIEYIKIPFNELAQDITKPAFINVMALGVLVERTGVLKKESIIGAMQEMAKTTSAKKAALLPNNIESLEYGIKILKEMMVK